ncbi:uncharacterized protein LOC127663479 [Xyrauchen texanus]|uniref:uncharacterized protein LOC127663479 n=1 Tax=Xyrauchen texanus TaxID=154827 RepID=UPI0022428CC9|nr:uncharacterized protein LOC127663479 [Xyrauchen texanus]
MERWVLERDSYSFLSSAPHTFNLQNRDGPNRVEIFDITAIPSHRSTISETTCLCDIFGDDCESPSLSSSHASATFVRKEVDQRFPTEDANDSSGSYHTANEYDLGDTTSPNLKDFSTSESLESSSPPIELTILSDSKNGLNPLEGTPPATKVNVEDFSQTDNWAEPQVSVSSTPVNKIENTNAFGLQDINSTPDTSLINPAKEPSDPSGKTSVTSSSLEDRESAFLDQEGIFATCQHTSTNISLERQGYVPIYESTNCASSTQISLEESLPELNNVVSSENKESMNFHSSHEESFHLAKETINSVTPSQSSNTSQTVRICSPIQEMSTLPENRDINFIPVPSISPKLKVIVTSPVSNEISFTPVSTGKSSPELLHLCSNQVGNTSEFPGLENTYSASSAVSTPPTNDNGEIDSLTVSASSRETKELVFSCNQIYVAADVRERLASPEINEILFPDNSAPAYSPEPIIIHSPMGYIISSSPIKKRKAYSTEPDASSSSPVITGIDYSDICSSPDHLVSDRSPEQIMIQSPICYTIIPSSTHERNVNSAEPEASPSFPIITRIENSDICSSPKCAKVLACSPEPTINHSYMGYTIRPSPTNEREVYSAEPNTSPSSLVFTGIDNSNVCFSPDHSVQAYSPEPAIIHSPVGYTISPSPTNERNMNSTEPEASPSSPVVKGIYYSEICSSLDHSVPAHSPIPVIIHSPLSYTVSTSPTNVRKFYSIEPDDLPSSPVVTRIDYAVTPTYSRDSTPELRSITSTPNSRLNYLTPEPTSPAPSLNLRSVTCSPEIKTITCSVLSQNTKSPVIGGITYSVVSPVDVLAISPSPTHERNVNSAELEASPSFPIITRFENSDICSSPKHSKVLACSPEPAIIHSYLGNTIMPSPTNERKVYSAEPNVSPSSLVVTGIDNSNVCSSPDHSVQAYSPEPAIIHSPLGYTIIPLPSNERNINSTKPDASPSSLVVTGIDNSGISPEAHIRNDASILATSRDFLLTPGSRSRPSLSVFNHIRDTTLSPDLQLNLEPSIPFEQTENKLLSIICDELNLPSPNPINSSHLDDPPCLETFKTSESVLEECRDIGPQVFRQMQILQDLPPKPLNPGSPIMDHKKNKEIVDDDTADSNKFGAPKSRSPYASSLSMPVESVVEKQCLEVCDSNSGAEILKNDSPSSDKRLCQVPIALRESPRAIRRDSGGKYDRKPSREKESAKREGEQHILGEGEETMGESSYRGEQVELSFSSRNSKGPADHRPTPSSRDPKLEIPARCYFESHPTTLQQQNQFRRQGSQQEDKGSAKRVQSALQDIYSSAGYLTTENTAETSSMGSEFDEADNEVKWLTDLAFRSLSNPHVDYLDVNNSSHRSSTNVLQPSTMNSPGAVAWMAYADLSGSTFHENDDFIHSSSFLPCDAADTKKRFEMESFECVDVALESKEVSSRGKRTVPKRQIQLLRRNTDESKTKENAKNVLDSCSKDILRQHSTPASVQEVMSREDPNSSKIFRKRTLQKSVSLDDASSKTQMASSIIKSVVSKKMQDAQKETSCSKDPSPSEDKNKHSCISPSFFEGLPSNMEKHSLSSSQHSECILLSEDFSDREERHTYQQLKKCAPKVPPKPIFRPAFINTGEAGLQENLLRDEIRPKMAIPFEDKVCKNDGKKGEGGNQGKRYNSDSANASARTTSAAVATQAVSMQNRTISRDTECQMTPETQRQRGGRNVFMSKPPEITLKPSTIKEKKKSSLKDSLSPDMELSKEMCESQSIEESAENKSTKSMVVTESEEDNDNSKTKSVIHRVRDVRKLVKNTYNLSFKALNTTATAEDTPIQEKRDKPPQTPPALRIECKAISWKNRQTSGSKAIQLQDETQAVDISKISQLREGAEASRDTEITERTSKASLPKILPSEHKATDSQCATLDGLNEYERSSIYSDQSTKQGMPPRPPSKEKEALVVLPDGTTKSIKNTFDSKITDPTQIEAASSSSHSVSMLLKEKGMQADIGVCDVRTISVSALAKHVNRLEVPLQACLSEDISSEAQVNTENTALSCSLTPLGNSSLRASHCHDGPHFKPKEQSESPNRMLTEESSVQQTKEEENKKITSTTTMTQMPTNLTTLVKPEVRSFSNNTKNNAVTTASKEIELPIQVRSISSDRLKTFVPSKPKLTGDSKKNEMPATLVFKDQQTSSSNTKRLALSAVSSCKPPPIPLTTAPSSVQKSTTITLSSVDQQQSSNRSTHQQLTTSINQDQSALVSYFASNPAVRPTGSKAHSHTQPVSRASPNNRFHTDDYHFYATDDPPSYDERESFSPLRLSDLHPQKPYRFHTTTKQSLCSCTSCSHLHRGNPNHSSQEQIPQACQSPGQVFTCPGAPPQAQVRPHQCRPDGQAPNYPRVSPNTSHAPALIQPLHHPRACPVANTQPYGDDQSTASGQHRDRHPANHHPPQVAGLAPYHEYPHSANMSTLDSRPQLFNPQDLPPSFVHDYGNEGQGGASVLYPENPSGLSCGQGPRRVLLDPETGKYFYIEVPMQPLRKMLFDPELGQYVEVLIPHQAMSHSGLYPPAAQPYSSLHNPGLYAPHYPPYAMPSYPAMPSSAQQVRHPELPAVPTTLHQTSLRYGSPDRQFPKNDPKGHSSLDQSYLESMYYIPTWMNTSPNSTLSDCYHKPPSSIPPSEGRRA